MDDAMAAMPSQRPMAPIFSLVVALMPISPGKISKIPAIFSFMAGMYLASFGFSAMTVLSMFPTMYPSSSMILFTSIRRRVLSAPVNRSSVSGK